MTSDQNATLTQPQREPARVLDVVVIGGGAAGLSAALTLARARREVLVVDAGSPRNAPAAGVHGFLTRDGISPVELTRLGRAEVESYGGEVLAGVATTARVLPAGGSARFLVEVVAQDGSVDEVRARCLIVATGLTDELPPVPGLAERWGRDVVHCPYCHGWEIRDQAIGVLATTAFATHQALLFRQWSGNVTLFLHEGPEPTDAEWDELAARGIAVVIGAVSGLQVEGDRLTGVTLASGRTVPVDALAVGAPVRSNAAVLAGLGIVAEPHSSGLGTTVPNDPLTGATAVPGVWVAGNVGDLKMQVVTAAAAGVWAGVAVNADLIADETASAVAARRAPFGAAAEADNSVAVLGERRHGLPDAPTGEAAGTEEHLFGRDYWEDRYGAPGLTWSGDPNPVLVTEATGLAPGRALDLGSGEGGDALWLAVQGWQVTGVDIAVNALEKAGARAVYVDPSAASRIRWEQHDLTAWSPEPRSYDLVSAQFMHLPAPARGTLFRSLAAAVAPGGTLLIVGHDVTGHDVAAHHAHLSELMFGVGDVLAAIDGEGLRVEVAESRVRAASVDDDGTTVARDVVVRATRAPAVDC